MSLPQKARRLVPAPLKGPARRALRAVVTALPAGVNRSLRRAVSSPESSGRPTPAIDPLGLADPRSRPSGPARKITTAAGRAAAAVDREWDNAVLMDRALHGHDLPRTAAGGRCIAALAAHDVLTALESAGHQVHPLIPGTTAADVRRGEAVVVDLEGFTGVWSGALDAEGMALGEELMHALSMAGEAGRSIWLVDRGPNRFRLGAVTLRRRSDVQSVLPGTDRTPQHITEDPGDAPLGLVDVLRQLESLTPSNPKVAR